VKTVYPPVSLRSLGGYNDSSVLLALLDVFSFVEMKVCPPPARWKVLSSELDEEMRDIMTDTTQTKTERIIVIFLNFHEIT